MGKVIYLNDRKPGVHLYTPEMGQRTPETNMEARLSWYGKHYYVDTPLELKGRGITKEDDPCWVKGSRQQIEGWKTYRVTKKAFEKLKEQYPIAMERSLD